MVIVREKSMLQGATFFFTFDPAPDPHSPPVPVELRILARRKRLPKSYLISLNKSDLSEDSRERRSKVRGGHAYLSLYALRCN